MRTVYCEDSRIWKISDVAYDRGYFAKIIVDTRPLAPGAFREHFARVKYEFDAIGRWVPDINIPLDGPAAALKPKAEPIKRRLAMSKIFSKRLPLP